MGRVRRSSNARRDLQYIFIRIARDSLVAADRWLDTMRARFEMLAAHPESGELCRTPKDRPVRRYSVGSYVIYFRPIEGGIEVLRVWHGARGNEPSL